MADWHRASPRPHYRRAHVQIPLWPIGTSDWYPGYDAV